MKTTLKNYIATLSLAGLFFGLSPFASAVDILYDQPFDNNTGASRAITNIPGWDSFWAGNGSQNTTRVSNQTVNGGAVWVENNNSAGFVVRGTDINVALSTVGSFSLDAIQSKADAIVTFLIQIDGGTWYSSTTTFTPVTAASWSEAAGLDYTETLAFSLSASAWQEFEMTSGGVVTTALTTDLTGSAITGIGWFVKSPLASSSSYNYTRFDTLVVSSIPEASTSLFALSAVMGLILCRRHLKRHR